MWRQGQLFFGAWRRFVLLASRIVTEYVPNVARRAWRPATALPNGEGISAGYGVDVCAAHDTQRSAHLRIADVTC